MMAEGMGWGKKGFWMGEGWDGSRGKTGDGTDGSWDRTRVRARRDGIREGMGGEQG